PERKPERPGWRGPFGGGAGGHRQPEHRSSEVPSRRKEDHHLLDAGVRLACSSSPTVLRNVLPMKNAARALQDSRHVSDQLWSRDQLRRRRRASTPASAIAARPPGPGTAVTEMSSMKYAL